MPRFEIKTRSYVMLPRISHRPRVSYSYIACNERQAFFTSEDTKRYKPWSCQNVCEALIYLLDSICIRFSTKLYRGERGGSVVECRTPEREVGGSKPTAAVLCPWARHFTPRKYWLITQEAVAPSRYDWKIVDWDVKPQHNQPTKVIQTNCWYSDGY